MFALEPKNESGLVAEVTLVLIARGKAVAETCKHIINLRWPNRDRFSYRDIDASTEDEVEGIIARVTRRRASGLANLL